MQTKRSAGLGCKKMKLHIPRGNKKKYFVFSAVVITLFLLVMLLPIFTITQGSPVHAITYIPTTPTGSTFGYVDVAYDYVIVTMNQNSSWLFDWGDGTTTSWLRLADGQTSITQSHHWITPGTYQLRAQFKNDRFPEGVWSHPLSVAITSSTPNDYPKVPVMVSGKIQGITDTQYTYSAMTCDPHGCQVSYRFDWGDGNLSAWTGFVTQNTASVASYSWEKPGEYPLKMQARNQYGLQSSWSEPIRLTIKNSLDDGGSIDLVVIKNVSHRIVFTSSSTGTLYNSSSGKSSPVQWNGGGEFLLDVNSNGRWDYLYVPTRGSIISIQEIVVPQEFLLFGLPWLPVLVIVGIIVSVMAALVALVKTGYIYTYEEIVVQK